MIKKINPSQFKRFGKKKQKSNATERDAKITMVLNILKNELEELTGHIYNNQDNNDFRITISKKT